MVNGLALVAVVLLPMQGMSGTAGDDAAKAIARLEDQLTLAFNRYDAAALGRLWADDLTFVFPNGALSSKKERLAGLASPPSDIPSSTNESVDVRSYGDVAVAIVVSRWNGTKEGKPFSMRFRATHVWAKTAGEWKLVSAHVSQIKE